ncbi:N/A [soil metagenome]
MIRQPAMQHAWQSARVAVRTTTEAVLRHLTAGVGAVERAVRRREATPRILCYHDVCDEPSDEWSVTIKQFGYQMELLARDYVPVRLERIVAWLSGAADLDPRSVAVTFDDGFADVADHAAPFMAANDVPGTAFVPAAIVSGDDPDSRYLPTRPFMQWSAIEELAAAGWTIGSHSLNHPRLSDLSTEDARLQIAGSRTILEQRLQQPVDYLAYPYGTPGAVSARDRDLAREAGYRAGFMAMTGSLEPGQDLWSVRRAKVLRTDSRFVVTESLRGGRDAWRHVEGSH